MKFFNLLYLLLPTTFTTVFSQNATSPEDTTNANTNINTKTDTDILSEVKAPSDCITLSKIYEYFHLETTGIISDKGVLNCCDSKARRMHSNDGFATTEWECESDIQNSNNHITSL